MAQTYGELWGREMPVTQLAAVSCLGYSVEEEEMPEFHLCPPEDYSLCF